MSDTTVTPAAPGAVSAKSMLGDDWPAQTADTIERFVGTIREKTTEPVEGVVRLVVYGILAAILGIAALVRLLDVLLPGEVWSAHLVLGALFTVAGLIMWAKRAPKDERR